MDFQKIFSDSINESYEHQKKILIFGGHSIPVIKKDTVPNTEKNFVDFFNFIDNKFETYLSGFENRIKRLKEQKDCEPDIHKRNLISNSIYELQMFSIALNQLIVEGDNYQNAREQVNELKKLSQK